MEKENLTMAKFPTYKYEFELDGEMFLLAIGESVRTKSDVVIKLHKFNRTGLMERVWYSLDGSHWIDMERGYRTASKQNFRNDFKKFRMTYPDVAGNSGTKAEEIKYVEA